MFRSKLFSILLGIGVSIGFAEEDQFVQLDAYSGVGSVLLHWSTRDIISEKVINIYKSTDRQKSYELIAEVNPELDRYLDTELKNGQIAFYYVECVVNENQSIFSDRNTPPFGQSMKIANSNVLFSLIGSSLSKTDKLNIQGEIILSDYLEKEFPSIDPVSLAFPLMNPDFISQWIGIIPNSELQLFFELLSTPENNDILTKLWAEKWNELETSNRNALLLTPEEYSQIGKELIQNIIEVVIPLHIDYLQRDLDFIRLSPSIIVKDIVEENGYQKVNFYSLKSISSSEIIMESGLEKLTIELSDILSDSSFDVLLPKEWGVVSIAFNDQSLGTFPLNSGMGTKVKLLDGTIISFGDVLPFPISGFLWDYDYFWFNEIEYNSHNHLLHVEIAGKSSEIMNYGLFFNDNLIWEINTGIQFEQTYFDSVFTLDMEDKIGDWLYLKVKVEGKWSTMSEARPIIFSNSKIEARIPDGGQWQEITFTTFGEANDFREANTDIQVIPEVFAMFQNYPNPFNASTSVSIDLIEPAVVDLFITDAGGRKIKEFVRSEALIPGQYSFVWDAHDHSSGVYFLTIVAQMKDFLPVVQSRKMIYLK